MREQVSKTKEDEREGLTLEETVTALGEEVCLRLLRRGGGGRMVYLLSVSRGVYSFYVEYKDKELCTRTAIPELAMERERAEAFCRAMADARVTPWSLEDVYEDMA